VNDPKQTTNNSSGMVGADSAEYNMNACRTDGD